MALSDHEKSVRAAVEKTERASKIRAAEWEVEKAEKALKTANDIAAKAREALKSAQLKLDALKDQMAMAESAAKREAAAKAAATKAESVKPAVPPTDAQQGEGQGDPLAVEATK